MALVLFALPLLGDITLGTALSVAGTVASFLLAPKRPQPTIKAMSSSWGDSWPIVYNGFRIPGKCIQAGDVTKNDAKSKKGGPTYSQTFAMGVCEGVRSIGRIWADSQCIYDPRAIADPPAWQANNLYGVGDQVMGTGISDYVFTASVNGESGATEPSWNVGNDESTRDNEIVWLATPYTRRTDVGQQYNFTMRIYQGSEDQLPDSALEEQVGVGSQPAYRGLCYVVFESFDLSKFGNRIPNLEFEVLGAEATLDNTGVLYGFAGNPNVISGPFLTDDDGNIYYIGSGVINIQTLAITNISSTRALADAAALGFPGGSFSNHLYPLVGKYFIALNQVNTGNFNYSLLLYEINTDGSVTAIGVKEYACTSDLEVLSATGISPSTAQIMLSGSTFASATLTIGLFDTIADLTGAYGLRPLNALRVRQITEITGGYSGNPSPFFGYVFSFVGNTFYICLGKAQMDWLASHGSGTGWNAYYASLQAAHPNGVMLSVLLAPTLGGDLGYFFNGVVLDFGWPFTDEGLNLAGSAGQTNGVTYDCWGPPLQTQDILGSVSAVTFTRGYSDADGEVGIRFFEDGAETAQILGAPFGVWGAGLSFPYAMFVTDGIYLTFQNSDQYYAKVGSFIPATMTLADICADVSGRVGLDEFHFDYSGLVSVTPRGVALLTRDTARSFLESMQPAFFYDLVDIGGMVMGSLRSNDTLLQTIPQDDLAASSAGIGTVSDMISSTRNDDLELPQDLSIQYYDVDHDYQQGSQQARRSAVTQYSSGRNTVSVPVVMNAGEANNAATRGLYLTWVERIQRKFTLPIKYFVRTPADTVIVQRNGRNNTVRLTNIKLNADWTLECEAVSEDLGTYSIQTPAPLASITSGSFNPQTVKQVTQPILVEMDTAMLRVGDTAPGVYVGSSGSRQGGGWSGAAVQESPDDSVFTTVATNSIQATIGIVDVALGNCPRYTVFDRTNTLTVSLYNGTLASADEGDLVDNFTNLAWLENGEIIQFATVTTNMDGTVTLSNLLRGRMGTEQFVGTHGSQEKFCLLDATTLNTVEYAPSDIGATRYWRALNDSPINPISDVLTRVMTTRRLMPFAPTFIRGSRSGGDLTITGLRRTRWRGRPLWTPPETDTPVTLEIDILNGSTVVRTLTATLSGHGSGVLDPALFTAFYSAADQVTDFGSAQASVAVKAYALNALVGRGYGGGENV